MRIRTIKVTAAATDDTTIVDVLSAKKHHSFINRILFILQLCGWII